MRMDRDAIVNAVLKVLTEKPNVSELTLIPAGISNRHVHLSEPDIAALFGEGYVLKPWKELSQKGYYACEETVTLVGPRGVLRNVRLLGPPRGHSQVELQLSDGYTLGVELELRDSGTLGTYPCLTIVGPVGAITNCSGIMAALRHIHMNSLDALALGLKDGDAVSVKTTGERSVVFNNVKIRVNQGFTTEIHLDTDEANAANIKNGDLVQIMI